MQKKQQLLTLFLGAIIIMMLSDLAASQMVNRMWLNRDARMTNPYSDVKAYRPGDLLVVLINEKSDVQNMDQRLLNKQGSSDLNGSFDYGLTGGVGSASGGASFGQQSDATRKFNGNTQRRSEREFTDQFTVRVIDVVNGNLLVHGTRDVMIDGDRTTLVLSGVVRQFDVSSRNTVSSQNVADLSIRYGSSGKNSSERHYLNQGWLGKRLNRWWPH